MISKIICYASDKQAVIDGRETYVFYFHPLRIKVRVPRFIGRLVFGR